MGGFGSVSVLRHPQVTDGEQRHDHQDCNLHEQNDFHAGIVRYPGPPSHRPNECACRDFVNYFTH